MFAQILPRLRRDVIEGRWKPGERLLEPVLCEQFGVSRTPLRDALRILASEGLVVLIPHVGAVVTKPEEADISGTFQILAVLEATAAETVARRRTPKVMAALRKLVQQMRAAMRANDGITYYTLNDEFHRCIVLASENASLVDIHEHLMWHVYRIRHAINEHEPFSEKTGKDHDEIMDLLEHGTPEQAFVAMRSHVQLVADKVVASAASLLA